MHILDALIIGKNCSRRQAKQYIRNKQVVCNDQLITDFNLAVDANWDTIYVENKKIQYPAHTYWVLNKPSGYVSAKKDKHYQTVVDLIDSEDKHTDLGIVGRLDRDTTGVMLLTDNGQLHYIMEKPFFEIQKTYRVTVNGPLPVETISQFNEGIIFSDGYQCLPAKLKILASQPNESEAEVTIIEGKRHQVKKMFLAVGVKVTRLTRVQMGPITLNSTDKMGTYRSLTAAEQIEMARILKLYVKR